MLDRVLSGEDPTAVWNERSNPLYQVKTVGEVSRDGWAVQQLGGYPVAGARGVDRPRLPAQEKREFSDWAQQVLSGELRATNEFRRVGVLPSEVLNDPAVQNIGPSGAGIETSDFLLRHGQRGIKASRSAALPMDDLINLPRRLEDARWYFDETHDNVVAFFDLAEAGYTGKAVVQFGYTRRGVSRNAVVTTGKVRRTNENEATNRRLI